MIRAGAPHEFLRVEYQRRRAKNPRYSLRAFSALLGLNSGRVSQLLSCKRPFTVELGKRIAQRLELSPARCDALMEAIRTSRVRSRRSVTDGAEAALPEMKVLAGDQYAVVGDPLHFTLLSLLETVDMRADVRWMAARLGSDAVTVRAVLERLRRVGLITDDREGVPRPISATGVRTSSDIPSSVLRRSHRRILAEASRSLESVSVDLREVSAITMAIDVTRLPEAKRLITEFRRRLATLLEGGERREVYRLAVQLYPVSQRSGAYKEHES